MILKKASEVLLEMVDVADVAKPAEVRRASS